MMIKKRLKTNNEVDLIAFLGHKNAFNRRFFVWNMLAAVSKF